MHKASFQKEDHLWLWGTTYDATDGPGGPSMAAILGPGDHPQQHILPQMVRGDLFGGDHLWHDSPQLQQVAKFLNSVASICAPCALVLFVATPQLQNLYYLTIDPSLYTDNSMCLAYI